MTRKPREPDEWPQPAPKPKARMHNVLPELPPRGPMRHVDRPHLAFQELLGALLVLAVFLAFGWVLCSRSGGH